MGKTKIKQLVQKKWNLGHLRSQKFAGLIFCTTLCFCAGLFQYSEPTTSVVIMGIVGCFTAFVGGRAWSDNAAMKFGGLPPNTTDDEVSVVRRRPKKNDEEKDKEREVD